MGLFGKLFRDACGIDLGGFGVAGGLYALGCALEALEEAEKEYAEEYEYEYEYEEDAEEDVF